MSEFDRALEVLRGAGSVAVACHVHPDGDALGSMLGLHLLCQANGMPSVASWGSPFVVAPHYEYLPGLDTVTKPADFPAEPEVMVTVDCGSLARLGDLADSARGARQLIVLDHHPDNKRFGTINVVLPAAAATAVIVRRLALELGWALTRDVAMCLYTGLVTDTGRFQHDNTTPQVFALAEELAGFDLPIADITRELFEKHRFAYIRLMGEALERARIDRERGFVGAWVSLDDLHRHGVAHDEAEGLIDILRRTAEATVSCVARETETGVRVSLRSVPDEAGHAVDVSAIATLFGGGGHRYAAGFVVDGTAEDAVRLVHDAL